MNSLLLFIGIMMMYSTPLALAASGSVLSEKSGVVNIGIDGIMTVGAFTGAAAGYYFGSSWIGFLCAGVAGGLLGLLFAVGAVSLKANQTVLGIAFNLIGAGVAVFACRILFSGGNQTIPVQNKLPYIFKSLPGNWNHLNFNCTTVIAFVIMLILYVIIYKTTIGMHITAVGENPAAADTLGINVSRIRYVCVIMSGVLSGIAGASVTLFIVSQFSPKVIAGQGFIAIAAVIFGRWTPHGGYLACILFGSAQALAIMLGNTALPSEILAMLPYLLTLIVIVVFSGRGAAPKASGIPYEKGVRL